MIVLLYSIILFFLCSCGGTTDAEDNSFEQSLQNNSSITKVERPITGFYSSNRDKGILDKTPNGKEDDIVYLLKKNNEDSYVDAIVAFQISSGSTEGSSSSEIDDAILENIYCFSKIADKGKNCIETIEFDMEDVKNGYAKKEIKISEGDVNEPEFYGLYTKNENNGNEATLLAKLHVYTYYEETYKINVFHVGQRFFFKNNFKSESNDFFNRLAVKIDYTETDYVLSQKAPGGYNKAYNYNIDGSYLAVKGSSKDECYENFADDIDVILDDIDQHSQSHYGSRIAVALGLATLNYWTFSNPTHFWDDEDEDYIVCKNDNDDVPLERTVYQITSIFSTDEFDCQGRYGTYGRTSLYTYTENGLWYFQEVDNFHPFNLSGTWTPGKLSDYIDLKCDVLMDYFKGALTPSMQHLEKHLSGGLGITIPLPLLSDKLKALVSLNAFNGGQRTKEEDRDYRR